MDAFNVISPNLGKLIKLTIRLSNGGYLGSWHLNKVMDVGIYVRRPVHKPHSFPHTRANLRILVFDRLNAKSVSLKIIKMWLKMNCLYEFVSSKLSL